MAFTPGARRFAAGLLITGLTLSAWTVAHASSPHVTQLPSRSTDSQLPLRLHVPAAAPSSPKPRLPNPCRHNSHDQLVIVSVAQQHEWACERHQVVQSTPVTTGAARRGDATPHGRFAVQGMIRNTTLTGGYSVRYWIPFHLGVWGFHDASWQHIPFGSPAYRSRGSHGCVHMPLAAIRWLFRWVRYGTEVRIT